MDYVGIATLISSVTASVVAIVGVVRGAARDVKLAQVHDLVNGQSAKIQQLAADRGFVEGGDAERANPTPKK